MKRLTQHIYSYQFPITNIINKYKSSILEECYNIKEKNKKEGVSRRDLTLQNEGLVEELCWPLENIVQENWYTGKVLTNPGIRVYVQTSNDFQSFLHSHEHLLGSISCVFYVDIPQNGGEIMFEYCSNQKPNGYNFKLKPEENQFYFFPMWLPHTPLPHKDENITRLCFNWFYCCEARAQHKYFGDRW